MGILQEPILLSLVPLPALPFAVTFPEALIELSHNSCFNSGSCLPCPFAGEGSQYHADGFLTWLQDLQKTGPVCM